MLKCPFDGPFTALKCPFQMVPCPFENLGRTLCSTSSLRAAIGWRKASEFHLSTSTEPKCILDPLLPIPLHLPAHLRRNMGLWYSNGLHHLWCCTPSCYTINNSCTCRLCGERQPSKSHLLSCRTSPLARHIVITPVNVNKLVNVLYVI